VRQPQKLSSEMIIFCTHHLYILIETYAFIHIKVLIPCVEIYLSDRFPNMSPGIKTYRVRNLDIFMVGRKMQMYKNTVLASNVPIHLVHLANGIDSLLIKKKHILFFFMCKTVYVTVNISFPSGSFRDNNLL